MGNPRNINPAKIKARTVDTDRKSYNKTDASSKYPE